MTLTKIAPRAFEQTFNNLASDLLFHTPSLYRNGATNRTAMTQAPANIVKNETGYELQLVAPGFEKEAFEVQLEKGLLTVSAAHKSEENEQKENIVRREFQLASFKRTWTLGESIDADGIVARYQNGILSLQLPLKAEVKEPVKQITIQ